MPLRSAKVFLKLNLLAVLMGVSLLSASGAIAQPQRSKPSRKASTFVFNPPTPPTGQGSPVGRRHGGASRRGDCNDYTGLTALVPDLDGVVTGSTTLAEPTLWFYMPSALDPETKVELVVQETSGKYVMQEKLNLKTDSAGIVPVKLDQLKRELEVGETYDWTLAIYCDPARRSASVYVQGQLSRVSDDAFQAEQMPAFKRAAQYAEQGIWFESLTLLAQLRRAEPDNFEIAQAWYDMLQQIELGSVAPAKLLFPGEMSEVSELR